MAAAADVDVGLAPGVDGVVGSVVVEERGREGVVLGGGKTCDWYVLVIL